jgi:hypothetical protein
MAHNFLIANLYKNEGSYACRINIVTMCVDKLWSASQQRRCKAASNDSDVYLLMLSATISSSCSGVRAWTRL